MRIDELDTPVPVVDLDIVEHNLAKMQAYCDSHGLALRPHIKTHKIPGFAHRQVELGAKGITCQKLGEAEVMIDAGLDDILISYPLVGAGQGRSPGGAVAPRQAAGRLSIPRLRLKPWPRRRGPPMCRSACWWNSTAAMRAPAWSSVDEALALAHPDREDAGAAASTD